MNENIQQKHNQIIQNCYAVIQGNDFNVESSSEHYYSVIVNGVKLFRVGMNGGYNKQEIYLHVPGVDGFEINSRTDPTNLARLSDIYNGCDKKWQSQHKQRAINALMYLEKFVKEKYTAKQLQSWYISTLEYTIIDICFSVVNTGGIKPNQVPGIYTIGDVFSIQKLIPDGYILEIGSWRKILRLKLDNKKENYGKLAELFNLCDKKWRDLESQRCDAVLKLLTPKHPTKKPDVREKIRFLLTRIQRGNNK